MPEGIVSIQALCPRPHPFAIPYRIGSNTMKAVFSDLDGTLLDHDTYDWAPARPALDRLKRTGTPCILVTSKTRAEVEFWRRTMANRDPFIVENGGAAFVPESYFPGGVPGAASRGEYLALEWGTPYSTLVSALEMASLESGCRVVGFHHMTVEEVAVDTGMSLEQAALAKQREYDEPFRILDKDGASQLLGALERAGLRWTEGGRYFHVTGNNDKAVAVRAVADLFRRTAGGVMTIGLGDGLNDLPFLAEVDRAVIVRSRAAAVLAERLPGAMVTAHPGPRGWNEAVLGLVAESPEGD